MNIKNIVRFNLWTDPAFDRILGAAEGIRLTVVDIGGSEDAAWAALIRAHIYQITSAKDELPRHWHATRDLLARCPDLLCVSTAGAGADTVDIQACTDAGVLVVNQAGGNAASVAEHAVGLMLAVSRRFLESDSRLRKERGFSREDLMGRELHGKVLGLVGLGHAGSRVARIAQAFEMPVLAFDPYLTLAEITERGASPAGLDEILRRSDIVSLHCPLTAETANLFNAAAFASMKPGALFITTARGGIHDERALYAALAAGHLGGAGLDVWNEEPPPLGHPLLALDNVVATFHTAGVTHEARRNVATMAAEQIVKICSGSIPDRILNKKVLPRFQDRLGRLNG